MRGSEALARIRAWEHHNPSLRPAVLIMCTGASLQDDSNVLKHVDAVWQKPFPDFTDNTMQSMLSELLSKRPGAVKTSPIEGQPLALASHGQVTVIVDGAEALEVD